MKWCWVLLAGLDSALPACLTGDRETEDEKRMAYQRPRDKAEAEELEVFFLRLAKNNRLGLRLRGFSGDFVLEPLIHGDKTDAFMEADLPGGTVRFDRNCGARKLHEILAKMSVPHEYIEDGHKVEVSLDPYFARKHLDEALSIERHRHSDGRWWRDSGCTTVPEKSGGGPLRG
jgi:hypothetical protein